MKQKTLYHVTPYSNVKSISVHGVSIKFAKGRLRVSWWVSFKALQWAIAHVSARYGIPVNEVVVIKRIMNNQSGHVRHFNRHIFNVPFDCLPKRLSWNEAPAVNEALHDGTLKSLRWFKVEDFDKDPF